MHTMIWHKKGVLALILLLSVILCACGGEEKAAPALAAAPADTEAAEVEAASLALEVVTPAPTQTPPSSYSARDVSAYRRMLRPFMEARSSVSRPIIRLA